VAFGGLGGFEEDWNTGTPQKRTGAPDKKNWVAKYIIVI
jgi:hypothetical protein